MFSLFQRNNLLKILLLKKIKTLIILIGEAPPHGQLLRHVCKTCFRKKEMLLAPAVRGYMWRAQERFAACEWEEDGPKVSAQVSSQLKSSTSSTKDTSSDPTPSLSWEKQLLSLCFTLITHLNTFLQMQNPFTALQPHCWSKIRA